MSIWHDIIRAGERAMTKRGRANKRQVKNSHYRQCNRERGINPKSWRRAQEAKSHG